MQTVLAAPGYRHYPGAVIPGVGRRCHSSRVDLVDPSFPARLVLTLGNFVESGRVERECLPAIAR